MATISWNGTPYPAEPVEELANGDWLMRMQQHGPRFTVGTIVRVKAKDIIEMAAAEMPPAPDASLVALQAAMDADKATRPTPAQLIANWRKGNGAQTTAAPAAGPATAASTQLSAAVAQAILPTWPIIPVTSETSPQDITDMSSKLAALPALAKSVAAAVEANASATTDRLNKAQAGAATAIDKLNTVAAGVEESTSALEDAVNQLTNGGPPLGH